jgi:outer membrane immunogenic protein
MRLARLLAIAVVALGAATSAEAGDLDWLDAPPAFGPSPIYDWTGFYLGLNGGYGFGSVPWTSGLDATRGTANVSGGLFGGTVGYNAQTVSSLVIGEEFDLAWNSLKATIPAASCGPNCELTTNWLATARLRIGYAYDRFMPYVTGGLAIGDLTGNIAGGPLGTQSHINLGWTAGVGLEYSISEPLSAKIEFLHVDVRGISCGVACGGGPLSMDLNENIIRFGINYRLWTK